MVSTLALHSLREAFKTNSPRALDFVEPGSSNCLLRMRYGTTSFEMISALIHRNEARIARFIQQVPSLQFSTCSRCNPVSETDRPTHIASAINRPPCLV
jgi:hypothetical protein